MGELNIATGVSAAQPPQLESLQRLRLPHLMSAATVDRTEKCTPNERCTFYELGEKYI